MSKVTAWLALLALAALLAASPGTAELVFGATGSGSGIGWYINNSRLFMNVADGFAGIILVVIVGLLTESLFRLVQRFTNHRWGTEAA